MIQIDITEEMKKRAALVMLNRPHKTRKIGGVDKSFTGYLGEEVCMEYLEVTRVNTFDYDFVDEFGNKIECKSQKSKYTPKDWWWAHVLGAQNQKCHYYLFVVIDDDKDLAWIVGYISKVNFEAKKVWIPKGTKEGNWTRPAGGWDVKFKDLIPLSWDHVLVKSKRVDNFIESGV
jgi:hypothetical protein